MEDFEASRDRVLMGQERDTMVIQDDERERIAFHEAVTPLAYVLDKTDPFTRSRSSRAVWPSESR